MKITQVTLYLVEQTLKSPFISSLETVENRESIIVELNDENGYTGWGEVVAFSSPWYTEETIKTCWHMISDFLTPLLCSSEIDHPSEVTQLFNSIKRNKMAKAGIETAVWDIYSKMQEISLSELIGGNRSVIDAGVVVGINNPEQMISKIGNHLKEGYKRIKVKIKPGQDYEVIKLIRDHYPNAPLMVDANSAYTLGDIDRLKKLDDFDLLMIEQPLAADDIIDHAKLQRLVKTPICLDESIVSYDDARHAIELGSCQVINIKIGRVGGLTEAINIHNLCRRHDIQVWCGGMLEMGISRAHNIALASLEGFTVPGDISSTSRYWDHDITEPQVVVKNGLIPVPTTPGIGFTVNRQRLDEITKKKLVIKK